MTKQHPSTSRGRYIREDYTDGNKTATDGPYFDPKTWVNTRDDSSNPRWRDQVKTHVSASTTISGSKRNFAYGDGSISLTYESNYDPVLQKYGHKYRSDSTGFRDIIDYQFGVADASALSESKALSIANTRLLAAIRGTYRQFQGGVFLGELKETIHAIRHPAQALRSGIDAYSKAVKKRLQYKRISATFGANSRRALYAKVGKNRADVKHQANHIVKDTWLEYVFGWKPLINDIDDAMKALAFKDYREYIPIYGGGRSTSVSSTRDDLKGYALHYIAVEWDTSSEVGVRIKGEVMGGPSSASQNIADRSRFGFGSWWEAVPTIWELIPYSFLVDYFTNVGDVLDAVATNSANVVWLHRSIRKENKHVLRGVYDLVKQTKAALNDTGFGSQSHYLYSSASYDGYSNSSITFSRGATNVPDIGLRFEIPGASSLKWLNIAALARLR